MKTNSEIRHEARFAMSNNWGMAIVITIIDSLISSITGIFLYGLPAIFVALPLSLGIAMTYLNLVRNSQPLELSPIFDGFKSGRYWKGVSIYLLVGIYTFLWTLLLIVPGIIKSLSYSLAPYIAADNPELSTEESICKSMEMMEGHKMQLFLMQLGYIALVLLSGLLFFLPILWLVPFYSAVMAKFYEEVKSVQNA